MKQFIANIQILTLSVRLLRGPGAWSVC